MVVCDCYLFSFNSSYWFLFHAYYLSNSNIMRKILIIICLHALLSTGTSLNTARKAVKFSPEETAIIRAALQKCFEKIGVPLNTLELIREGVYLETDAFKEYVYCAYQESGFANPDGHVIISKAVQLFPKELNMLPVLENCDKQGKDPVETNFLAFKCFQDTSPVRMAL